MSKLDRLVVTSLLFALVAGACGGGMMSSPSSPPSGALPAGGPTDARSTAGLPASPAAGQGSPAASASRPSASPVLTTTMAAPGTPASPPATAPVSPAPAHDAIAYVRGPGADEIRLIDPDGGNDRGLWAHGYDDPHDVYDVWSLAWNPAATELAFASTHENWCSINASDVFVVGADGIGYRRVTQAPACADLGRFPTGTVRIPLRPGFFGGSFTGFVYFQGAPELHQVSVGPGSGTDLVIENVADFGPGVPQFATLIEGTQRDFDLATSVDVLAGSSVTTGALRVASPSVSWEPRSPTWRVDGSELAYAYGFNSLFTIDAHPDPVDFGRSLLADGAGAPNIVLHMARGPTTGTADAILYQGNQVGVSEGIYLVQQGSATGGEALVVFAAFESVKGLAWLPDGSGFLYSVTEGEFFPDTRSGNIFRHTFATGETTRVTDFRNEYTGLLSVSSDGDAVVFERARELHPADASPLDPDLWIVAVDGSGLRLLVEDARAPAWSR